jgi:hypothetical protein
MALTCALSSLRRGLLSHLRLPLQSAAPLAAPGSGLGGSLGSLVRGFAGGGYLDKDDVTTRVLHVTKHFEKIDPAKVCARRWHPCIASVAHRSAAAVSTLLPARPLPAILGRRKLTSSVMNFDTVACMCARTRCVPVSGTIHT